MVGQNRSPLRPVVPPSEDELACVRCIRRARSQDQLDWGSIWTKIIWMKTVERSTEGHASCTSRTELTTADIAPGSVEVCADVLAS